MPDLWLRRVSRTPFATYGVLLAVDGPDLVPFCLTLERPWLDNAQRQSSIPAGSYVCRPYSSAKFPDVWEVVGVPNRSAVLIHSGNLPSDSLGCILVGETFARVGGLPGIGQSRDALAELREMQRGVPSFHLAISDP